MNFNFFKKSKRPEIPEIDVKTLDDLNYSYLDEFVSIIFDFFNDNQEEGRSTQFILTNGKSILVPPSMELVRFKRYLGVYDEKDVQIAILDLGSICAMCRVPRDSHCGGVL